MRSAWNTINSRAERRNKEALAAFLRQRGYRITMAASAAQADGNAVGTQT